MTAIESPHNPRLREAVALRDRRHRMATGRTIVDGGRECRRAIEAGVFVEAAFVSSSGLRSTDAETALGALQAHGTQPIEVSERAFEKLAFGDRDDGLVLVVATPDATLDSLSLGTEPLILVTEDVEKPGNLGAIVRTADAAGCDAVIAIGGTDLFNPNVIRASAGTVFSMPLAAASAGAARAWLRERGIRIVATRVDAEPLYSDADLRGALAIVMGSEALGLSASWLDPSIEAVRLPMLGVADSLNVSVTAAILAYEARRQRDMASLATSNGGDE